MLAKNFLIELVPWSERMEKEMSKKNSILLKRIEENNALKFAVLWGNQIDSASIQVFLLYNRNIFLEGTIMRSVGF